MLKLTLIESNSGLLGDYDALAARGNSESGRSAALRVCAGVLYH